MSQSFITTSYSVLEDTLANLEQFRIVDIPDTRSYVQRRVDMVNRSLSFLRDFAGLKPGKVQDNILNRVSQIQDRIDKINGAWGF